MKHPLRYIYSFVHRCFRNYMQDTTYHENSVYRVSSHKTYLNKCYTIRNHYMALYLMG